MEKVRFSIVGEDDADFFVLEQTTISGFTYILITDQEEGDADCWILKEMRAEDGDVVYELIEDDQEQEAVAGVFAQMMDEDTELSY